MVIRIFENEPRTSVKQVSNWRIKISLLFLVETQAVTARTTFYYVTFWVLCSVQQTYFLLILSGQTFP